MYMYTAARSMLVSRLTGTCQPLDQQLISHTMICAMRAHVTRALLHAGEVIRPRKDLLAGFHRHQQEDAHEFLPKVSLEVQSQDSQRFYVSYPNADGDCSRASRSSASARVWKPASRSLRGRITSPA